MSKLSNSWSLIKASASVLKKEKKLILLPIISTVMVILIALAFFLPLILNNRFRELNLTFSNPAYLIYLFLFYFLSYTVMIFFNSVLITAALRYLNGEEISLSYCFSSSFSKLGIILPYAFISGTAGIILNGISEKGGIIGKIFSSFADLAWNVITFLVVPVLVAENVGPIEAIKRSSALLKQTWGENLIGNIGIGLFFGIITLALAIMMVPLAIYFSIERMMSVTILIGTVFTISAIILALLSSTLTSIYTAALYRFASSGLSGDIFGKSTMIAAFSKK